jgi:hypothetical protein
MEWYVPLRRPVDPSHSNALRRYSINEMFKEGRRYDAKTKSQFISELQEIPDFEITDTNKLKWFKIVLQVTIDGVSQGQLVAMTPTGDEGMVEVAFLYNEYTDMTDRDFNIFIPDDDKLAGDCKTLHKDRVSVWMSKEEPTTAT